MFTLCGRTFHLAKVGLVRAGCPLELANTVHNRMADTPIVIARNEEKLGFIQATSYHPTGVIVIGARRRSLLLDAGFTRSWAYVEAGALEIQADDAISCAELLTKLDSLMLEKFYGPTKQPVSGQPWPYINEVYPFENYCIYSMKGQHYRQGYALDPIERKVALKGGSTAVNEKWVNAGEAKESMTRVQTGVRYAYAPTKGNDQSFTTGGKHSELVTQIVRNFSNILEAVNMFLNYTRLAGRTLKTPMVPTHHPVTLSPEHKIVATLAAKGIDVYDFAKWAAAAQLEAATKGTKQVGTGQHVHHSKFAYVGNVKDPSTWHLPIPDASHAKNALARLNQTKGIPEAAKPGVLKKIRRVAKTKGVDVSDKPTSGQKKWVKGNMVGIMPPSVPSTMSRGHSTGRTV